MTTQQTPLIDGSGPPLQWLYRKIAGGKSNLMGQPEDVTKALEEARKQGIDLTQLYERSSWTPTERIKSHFKMLKLAKELRRAGQQKSDGSRT